MNVKTKKTIAAVAVLAVLIAVVVGCWLTFGAKGTAGQKTITVEVTFGDKTTKDFSITTNEEFLRGALEQEKLIEGEDGEYGLFVKTVDGVTVDDSKQEWWNFTKGGEMLNTGVDATPIADGESYEIVLTTGY